MNENFTPKQPRVLAAMSGGVDSSVATALLAEQGFEVTGSMLRFWPDERPAGAFDLCCSPTAAYDARRMADRIDVPFYLLDFRDKFDEVVIEPFAPAYLDGQTPNPCVWCNREIKFGSFIKRAQALNCEFMATGHYVRRVDGPNGTELHRGADDSKDQTYFLWALPREILRYLLFPLGEFTKEQVRRMADERGFSVAEKPSSSGLCFIATTVKDYLKDNTEARPGKVLDAADNYSVAGEHQGIQFFTIGQKKGLNLYKSHLDRVVIALRAEDNAVIVGTREMASSRSLSANRMNLLCDASEVPRRVMAQVRYRQQPVPATISFTDDGFDLEFDDPLFAVTLGQSAVLYDGNRLLGGGVITQKDDAGLNPAG